MYINHKRFENNPELLEELRKSNGKNNAVGNIINR